MFYKIRTNYQHREGRFFAWMSLILAVVICIIFPILPNFIKSIVGSDSAVSLFYSFLAIVTLISGLTSGFIFRKMERTAITKAGLALLALVTFSLIFVTKFIPMAILLILKTWLEMILLITLALFVRDFAKAKNLSEEEGMRFRFQNIGALMGLFLGGFLASQLDYELVFVAEALIAVFGLAYFYQKHIVENHPAIINSKRTEKINLLRNIREFFHDSERAKIFIVAIAQMLWISFKYIYIPLYVANTGYLSSMSGLILAIAMFPVIIFETKTGEFGKIFGDRKIITIGFLIIGILLTVIFVSPWPLLNFGLLAVANVGSAFIEPLRETYFLKNTPKEKENDFYGIYMTSEQLAHFLTPLFGVITLAFLPFKFLFLVFGALMFLTALFTWFKLRTH